MCDINHDDNDIRSSVSDFAKPPFTEYVPSVPGPGKTYKIYLKNTDKVITMIEGEVVLQSAAGAYPGGGCYWACVETYNWLGFRNRVSGTFLGHNGKLGLQAKVTHHKAFERFCVRHHRDGGYVLLVFFRGGEEMLRVGYTPHGMKLFERKDFLWAFEEV